MERNAIIKVRESADGEPVLMTTGKIIRLGGSLNIIYGQEGAFYTIGISDGIVSISRESDEDYSLILCEGKEDEFTVSTPFGDIDMKVVPERVFYEENEQGIRVELVYDLVGGGGSETFRLYLECKYDD